MQRVQHHNTHTGIWLFDTTEANPSPITRSQSLTHNAAFELVARSKLKDSSTTKRKRKELSIQLIDCVLRVKPMVRISKAIMLRFSCRPREALARTFEPAPGRRISVTRNCTKNSLALTKSQEPGVTFSVPVSSIASSIRNYAPAGRSPRGPETQSPATTTTNRSPLVRFLNPWIDMANVTDDDILAFKVESVTRTFGVVAGLMCSLSAAAIVVTPSAANVDEETNEKEVLSNIQQVNDSTTNATSANDQRQDENTLLESLLKYIVNTDHVAGTSLLVQWGVPPKQLADIYSACCAAAFYNSVCAMGLSAVLNAWLGCTPPGGTKHFVRYHSLVICAIPGLLAVSTGLAGVALFIGLDRSKGTPISYIGLGGTVVGGLFIGTATARGLICTYRLLTPLVKKL